MVTVLCERCNERLVGCEKNEHGFPLAAVSYRVGNYAGEKMGHAVFFDKEGQVALCAAEKQPGKS